MVRPTEHSHLLHHHVACKHLFLQHRVRTERSTDPAVRTGSGHITKVSVLVHKLSGCFLSLRSLRFNIPEGSPIPALQNPPACPKLRHNQINSSLSVRALDPP